MNIGKLAARLPPFRGQVEIISKRQNVPEIMNEVLTCHQLYSGEYDNIAGLFDKHSVDRTCRGLFDFCVEHFPYNEETEKSQTVVSPGGLIWMADVGGTFFDCKHYASFIAGVLDALKRQGKKIDWYYRFCSYDWRQTMYSHVYVVVRQPGTEIWIDPAPLEDRGRQYNDRMIRPIYFKDQNIPMALYRISGRRGMGLREETKSDGSATGSGYTGGGYVGDYTPYVPDQPVPVPGTPKNGIPGNGGVAYDPGYVADPVIPANGQPVPDVLPTTGPITTTDAPINEPPTNAVKFSFVKFLHANPGIGLLLLLMGVVVINEVTKSKKR